LGALVVGVQLQLPIGPMSLVEPVELPSQTPAMMFILTPTVTQQQMKVIQFY
jgi:hypothetical protein